MNVMIRDKRPFFSMFTIFYTFQLGFLHVPVSYIDKQISICLMLVLEYTVIQEKE